MKEQENKKASAHKGVVAVLAQKEVIDDALKKGYSMRVIYQVLVAEGLMPVSYSAFARLVKIYIKDEKQQKSERLPKGAKGSKEGKEKPRVYNPDNYDPKKLF